MLLSVRFSCRTFCSDIEQCQCCAAAIGIKQFFFVLKPQTNIIKIQSLKLLKVACSRETVFMSLKIKQRKYRRFCTTRPTTIISFCYSVIRKRIALYSLQVNPEKQSNKRSQQNHFYCLNNEVYILRPA